MNYIYIANWKMNFLLDEAYIFCEKLQHLLSTNDNNFNIIIAVPYLYLISLQQAFPDLNFAAQDVSHITQNFGPYTGEISAYMLNKHKINFCLIGHSERQKHFGESSEMIKQKFINCFNNKITPIVCVGESIAERAKNTYLDVITQQLDNILEVVNFNQFTDQIIIAYEPQWAIGNNKPIQLIDLDIIFQHIVKILKLKPNIEKTVKLVYGGSVDSGNVTEILAIKGISGVLVGGCSLKIAEFSKICQLNI